MWYIPQVRKQDLESGKVVEPARALSIARPACGLEHGGRAAIGSPVVVASPRSTLFRSIPEQGLRLLLGDGLFRAKTVSPVSHESDHERQESNPDHAEDEKGTDEGSRQENMAGLVQHDGIDDDLEKYADEPSAGVGRGWRPWPIRVREEAGEEVKEDANV